MKVPKVPFVKGTPETSQAEVEAEAAAELRRAMAMGDPRPGASRSASTRNPSHSPYSRRPEPPLVPGAPAFGPTGPSATPDDEKQAITDLALQQFAERGVGVPRRGDLTLGQLDASSPEEMRNRALAELAERRNRMARENPPAPPSAGSTTPGTGTPGSLRRVGEPVVQRRSGMTVSPRLTVAPTLTSSSRRAPTLGDITGRPQPIPTLSDIEDSVKRSPSPPAARAPRVPPAPLESAPQARAAPPGSRAFRVPPAAPPNAPTSRVAPAPAPNPAPSRLRTDSTATVRAMPQDSVIAARPAPPAARTPKVALTPRDAAAGAAARPAGGAVARAAPAATARRVGPGVDNGDAPWRLLVELGDLLGRHVFPIDALGEVCQWLADATGSEASIMLLASSGVDEVVAWPPDAPLSVGLAALTGGPLDQQSALWAAVRDGATVVADADQPMILPAGVPAEGVGAAALVPLVGGDMTFGVLMVHQPDSDAISDGVLALVEQVAPRLALALGNAEQASLNGGATPDASAPDEEALAEVSVATLSAVAILLGSLEALPAPSNHRYDEIARSAANLRNLVEQFLDDITS